MKVNPKYAGILMSLFTSIAMSFFMSFAMQAYYSGIEADFFIKWMKTFVIAFSFALVIVPLVKKLVSNITGTNIK